MAISLTLDVPSGNSIAGYKVYKNYTSVYAGGSAFFRGNPQDYNEEYTYFLANNQAANASGTLTKMYIGGQVYGSYLETKSLVIYISTWNVGESAGYPLFTKVNDYTYYKFLGASSGDRVFFEVDLGSGIPITAGQVLSISTYDQSAYGLRLYSNGINDYTYYNNGTYGHISSTSIRLDSGNFANTANYYSGDHLSVEFIGDMDGTWEEETDGGCGLTEEYSSTSVPPDNTWVEYDLGSSTEISFLRFYGKNSGGTTAAPHVEIQISDIGSSTSWISVYDGYPYYFGSIVSSSSIIGFPYTTRYIRLKQTAGSGSLIVSDYEFKVYTPTTSHDGFKYVNTVASGTEYIKVGSGYPSKPYWYKVIPVDTSGNIGNASIIVSNRHNI